jgi:hypothetical protein
MCYSSVSFKSWLPEVGVNDNKTLTIGVRLHLQKKKSVVGGVMNELFNSGRN